MSELSLSLDKCVSWAMNNIPVYTQSRYITDIYKKNKTVTDAKAIIRTLDPKNFMFTESDVYYRHIDMIKNIAASANVTWKNEVDHTIWISQADFNTSDWLEYYLNPSVLIESNVSQLPIDICKIMLGQLRFWYLNDPDIHACCLIAYLDQIYMLLMRAGSPEYIEIFNQLATEYTGSNVVDCPRCAKKGRKNQRIIKYGY